MRTNSHNAKTRALAYTLLAGAIISRLLGAAPPASADTFEWRNPVDGFYFTNTNWNNITGLDPGPPGTGDPALFNESGSYEVWFANNEHGESVEVSAGNVTFRSLGTDRSYTLNNSLGAPFELAIPSGSLTLGVAGDPLDLVLDGAIHVTDGVLHVNDGSDLTASNGALIGQNGNGLLFVNGAGSTMTGSRIIVGFGGQGAVSSVSAGGQITTLNPAPGTQDLLMGVSFNQVHGPGSSWTSNGMNVFESALLDVRNFGQLNVSSMSLSSANSMAVYDSGQLNVTDQLQIGDFGHSGRLEIFSNGVVDVANTLNIDSVSSVDVNDGYLLAETLNIDGTLNVQDGEVKVANFTKNGGTLNQESGRFEISGGTGTFNSSHDVGGSLPATSIFRIQDGADVSVTDAWSIGSEAEDYGSTIVVGTNGSVPSTLRGTAGGAGADLYVGGRGDGILLANFGGHVELRDDVIVGASDGSRGQLTISNVENGIRSTVDATAGGSSANILIGGEDGAGLGLLTVQGGGLLVSGNNIYFAREPGSEGFGTIGGNFGGFDAEMIATNDIFVGGDASNPGGTSVVTISTGGRVQADELIVWAGSEVNLNGGALSLNRLDVNTHGGIVHVSGDSNYDVDVTDGDFDMVGGTITPGDSPGIMTVNGNYTTMNTTLEIEIGGRIAGTEFDRVEVTGTAMIDGTLDVSLYDLGSGTFIPVAGDTFDIFSATGGIVGAFGAVNTPSLPAGLAWNVSYGANVVSLDVLSSQGDFNGDGLWDQSDIDSLVGAVVGMSTDLTFDMNGDGQVSAEDITADAVGWLAVGGANNSAITGGNPFLVGDANLDSFVDGQDFLAWNTNKFSAAALWSAGDFTANGTVDGQDFLAWNTNKFTTNDVAGVPEPAGLLMLVCLIPVVAASRRHQE